MEIESNAVWLKMLTETLKEIEKELTVEDDLNHVRYFLRLLKDGNVEEESSRGPGSEAAFRITENLKKNIFNGDDET